MYFKKEYRRVFENFCSTPVLNIANYIFPIILIPYLTMVLGVEKYGIYIYAYTIMNYFTLFVSYGFEYSCIVSEILLLILIWKELKKIEE